MQVGSNRSILQICRCPKIRNKIRFMNTSQRSCIRDDDLEETIGVRPGLQIACWAILRYSHFEWFVSELSDLPLCIFTSRKAVQKCSFPFFLSRQTPKHLFLFLTAVTYIINFCWDIHLGSSFAKTKFAHASSLYPWPRWDVSSASNTARNGSKPPNWKACTNILL